MTLEARARLVLELRAAGVRDPRTLSAMEAVDRAAYVPDTFAAQAWDDTPLPIASGQTISQPSVVARMTEALSVGPGDVVLEIGTGSGYQADVLSRLARRVVTVERIATLAATARRTLEGARRNVTVLTGDGGLGAPWLAPFDRILLTAAAEDAPGPLLDQLRTGGIMVLPVGPTGAGAVQTLVRITREADGFAHEDLGPARFVPLVEGHGD